MLALTAQSPGIEHLNEVSLKLPLSDVAMKTLQKLEPAVDPGHGDGTGTLQSGTAQLPPSVSIMVKLTVERSNVIVMWLCSVFKPCSELQEIGLNEKFLDCCEKWIQL